ncbi:MAG TPA: O-antigen ligase family protein, partial [Gaiellaceae bacterium]|nr:O-antigen ligase family protein [Gaiellaceae bacterium]
MRIAGERAGAAGLTASAVAFCALFLANGSDVSRLVWIGGLALVLAALVAAVRGVATGRAGALFLGCLLGLVVWTGASTVWSLSPDSSWQATNRVLVYAAFAVAGTALAARPSTVARVAAVLLAALFGWALLAKCVPPLYSDYGRIARLRSPLDYWNELGLLGAAGVPLALWLRGRAGAVLLFAATLVTLLTYSRVGIALALLAGVAWLLLDRERVRSLGELAVGGGVGLALFGVALALPGITSDGEPEHVRWRDGLIFAVLVLAATALVAFLAPRLRLPAASERWAARAGVVAAVAVVVLAGVFAQRLWHGFANPVTSQIGSESSNVASFNSGNRWRWWQEEWTAFTDHPALGTGAGTFHVTDLRLRQSSLVTTDEPHNTPLQMLGELGLPGLLLYLGAIAAAAAGIVRARRAAAPEERAAVAALGLALAVFA